MPDQVTTDTPTPGAELPPTGWLIKSVDAFAYYISNGRCTVHAPTKETAQHLAEVLNAKEEHREQLEQKVAELRRERDEAVANWDKELAYSSNLMRVNDSLCDAFNRTTAAKEAAEARVVSCANRITQLVLAGSRLYGYVCAEVASDPCETSAATQEMQRALDAWNTARAETPAPAAEWQKCD